MSTKPCKGCYQLRRTGSYLSGRHRRSAGPQNLSRSSRSTIYLADLKRCLGWGILVGHLARGGSRSLMRRLLLGLFLRLAVLVHRSRHRRLGLDPSLALEVEVNQVPVQVPAPEVEAIRSRRPLLVYLRQVTILFWESQKTHGCHRRQACRLVACRTRYRRLVAGCQIQSSLRVADCRTRSCRLEAVCRIRFSRRLEFLR